MRKFGLQEMRFRFDMGGTGVVSNDPFFAGDNRGGMLWVLSPSWTGGE